MSDLFSVAEQVTLISGGSRGIGRALLLSTLHAMSAAGYAYAIVGGAGDVDFYAQTVGAIEIAGSTPGIYRDRLTASS